MDQVANGLLQRTWARAFIIADAATGKRVLFITADLACVFTSHHPCFWRVGQAYGDTYNPYNVNINATHNHNSCGGTSWTTRTFRREGPLAATRWSRRWPDCSTPSSRRQQSLAPGTVELGHLSAQRECELLPAGLPTRCRSAPLPAADRPSGHSTATAGRVCDRRDHVVRDARHVADRRQLPSSPRTTGATPPSPSSAPGVISAHAQTNAGDMTPNLWLRRDVPGGP